MSVDVLHPLRLLILLLLCGAATAACLLFSRRGGKKRAKRGAVPVSKRARGRGEILSYGLHGLAALLCALALAGTGILAPSPDRSAFLLLDVSASVDEEEVLSLAREALSQSDGRAVGVIAFGRDARVERGLNQSRPLGEIESRLDRSGSDLGEALALARALLPTDANGGIAVISDGRVSLPQGTDNSAFGLPVNVLKTAPRSSPDAQITKIDLPAFLYAGQKYVTTVSVDANVSGPATVVLFRNHRPVETREVTLRKGENTFAFESRVEEGDATVFGADDAFSEDENDAGSGIVTFEAQVMMEGDTVSANDRNAAFTTVAGRLSVLLAEGQSGAGEELRKMLSAAGFRVQVVPVSLLPGTAQDLWAYQAVALVNADADSLRAEQISALAGAARELGVGVAVFGGDQSFALGSYRGSALEDMLPVTVDVRNRLDLPTTALVLVIDKSGSMMEEAWGVSRLALAREAACAALDVLNERDQAGVIAFDDEGKWVVPLAYVTDRAGMQDQVATIRSGGGTAFYTPLKMAAEALRNADAQYKHVIFLTDGEAGDTGYEDVVRGMAEDGITLTAVAVGDGADLAGLRRLATMGGGRMYAAGPFDSLPRIFTRETMRITGSYVQNRRFIPLVSDPSMTDFEAFPALDGYLATAEKPLATVSLISDREDPILAWWTYGAGRVACWTSDVQGGWSASFLSWPQAAAFFSGMISFVAPEPTAPGRMTILPEEGVLRFEAETTGLRESAADGKADTAFPEEASRAEATVMAPDGSVRQVRLERVSANAFEGPLEADQQGAWAVRLSVVNRDGEPLLSTQGGAVVSGMQEYSLLSRDEGALEALAAETGGQVCASPEGLLRFPDTAARKRWDLTPIFAMAAGLIFLFDIAQSRLGWIREKEETKETKETKEKKEKNGPSGRSPRGRGKAKAPTEEARAVDVLWDSMQGRKKL